MTPITISDLNSKALKYVGTVPEEGLAQLECLKSVGLQPNHHLLEIGCGALIAGIPIMGYLDVSHYTGIEPNRWLVEETANVPENLKIIIDRQPKFLDNEKFDSSVLDIKYDYIIAHSILSHTSKEQVQLFLKNCSKVLAFTGTLLFSCILTKNGEPETIENEWVYPGSVFVNEVFLVEHIKKYFKYVEKRDDMKQLILASHSSSCHDWFLVRH